MSNSYYKGKHSVITALFKAFKQLFGLKSISQETLSELESLITWMEKFYLSKVHWKFFKSFMLP